MPRVSWPATDLISRSVCGVCQTMVDSSSSIQLSATGRLVRLNWAMRTSWGWWDDWDDTVLQTQDSKFEPWRSETEHATSRSRKLPTILTFTRGWGRNIFCFFQTAETGNRTPNSDVKGSGANHYPRAPTHLMRQDGWNENTDMAAGIASVQLIKSLEKHRLQSAYQYTGKKVHLPSIGSTLVQCWARTKDPGTALNRCWESVLSKHGSVTIW